MRQLMPQNRKAAMRMIYASLKKCSLTMKLMRDVNTMQASAIQKLTIPCSLGYTFQYVLDCGCLLILLFFRIPKSRILRLSRR